MSDLGPAERRPEPEFTQVLATNGCTSGQGTLWPESHSLGAEFQAQIQRRAPQASIT